MKTKTTIKKKQHKKKIMLSFFYKMRNYVDTLQKYNSKLNIKLDSMKDDDTGSIPPVPPPPKPPGQGR